MEVAVIAMSPEEEAVLGKQHELYQEDAAAQRSSSSSSSSSSPLLQQPDFLAANAAAIEVNSGDYTCWYLRRRFLSLNPKYLNRDELSYCRYMCSINLKNYQCWFHRRWILEHITTVSFSLQEETDSVKETLAADSKNYNSWAHRRHLPAFEQHPTNESLVAFLLGCLKEAAAAARQQKQQQKQQQQQQQQQEQQQQEQQDEEHPKELREVIEALLSAAARVAAAAAAAGGAARLGLEVGVAVDELRGDYKAAHKVIKQI
ncbi:hypothetical protein, conserved [Eimeria acervulina]|uniref:Uncharacterized protein n=1 Tax=Eimeria acervulina TaxID=5801 RepID=U6G8C1_EIMAC|nr:hypothetical protein, conserved [Eimeria acervulina]CDI76496.1 hypothetical protein, conserved [Eimeria acervulina]